MLKTIKIKLITNLKKLIILTYIKYDLLSNVVSFKKLLSKVFDWLSAFDIEDPKMKKERVELLKSLIEGLQSDDQDLIKFQRETLPYIKKN